MNTLRVRSILLAFMLVLHSLTVFGQSAELNVNQRNRVIRSGMSVLGGWALGNFALSGPLYFATEGETKFFHEMNVGWNLVNLGIATAGLLGNINSPYPTSYAEALDQQRNFESALLFNAGVDIGYMAAGWALRERSQRDVSDAQRLAGWGTSLIVQGAFLFVFDIVMFVIVSNTRPVPASE